MLGIAVDMQDLPLGLVVAHEVLTAPLQPAKVPLAAIPSLQLVHSPTQPRDSLRVPSIPLSVLLTKLFNSTDIDTAS